MEIVPVPGGPSRMERIEKTVFISYRRINISWAVAVFRDLTSHGFDVFIDYEGIASGDFEQVILENIKARAHFLLLLTPTTLDRCDDPGDMLRREIESALDNQRNIVPLMLDGFEFGAPTTKRQLVGKLAPLSHYNGLPVPATYFEEAMDRLRNKYLSVALTAVLHPASPEAQRAAKDQKVAADAAPVVTHETLAIRPAAADATRKQNLALSHLEALHKNPPTWWGENEVRQYHQIITALEEAFGYDLSSFRVPQTMMTYAVTALRLPRLSRPGSVQRSSKLSCDHTFMERQLDGLSAYLRREAARVQEDDERVKEQIFIMLSRQREGNAFRPQPGSDEFRLCEEMVRDGRLTRQPGGIYMLNYGSTGDLYGGRSLY